MTRMSKSAASLSDWLVVGSTVLLGGALFLVTGRAPGAGDRVEMEVTVVPDDRRQLACASPRDFGGLRCQFAAPSSDAEVKPLKGSDALAPYVTTDRHLVVLSGLFSHESVQKALKARQRMRPAERRFRVTCQVELLEKVSGLPVSFGRTRDFRPGEEAWVGRTLDCQAEPGPNKPGPSKPGPSKPGPNKPRPAR